MISKRVPRAAHVSRYTLRAETTNFHLYGTPADYDPKTDTLTVVAELPLFPVNGQIKDENLVVKVPKDASETAKAYVKPSRKLSGLYVRGRKIL